jgi:hypothetical protein
MLGEVLAIERLKPRATLPALAEGVEQVEADGVQLALESGTQEMTCVPFSFFAPCAVF